MLGVETYIMEKSELNKRHRENWKKRYIKSKEFGKQVSRQNKVAISDLFRDPILEWKVVIKIPFQSVVSKNMAYGRGRKGWRFLKEAAKSYVDAIALSIKAGVKGIEIKQHKIWVEIYVEKAHHGLDAVNVIDLVCDAIKLAIPVDDRWYSIRRLDWSVNKDDPHLFIGIGQEVGAKDSKICRRCGTIRPLLEFNSATVCRDCRLTRKHVPISGILNGG